MLDEAHRAMSTCIRCTWCDGYPCLVHAKSDAESIAVRPILDEPNVTLLVNAEVTRLVTDASGGAVTSVVVSRDGAEETYEADIVALSAGAHEHREDPVGLCERPASERARERLGPGRTQLHVPQQQGGGRAFEGAQRHGVPEDARPERLLPRRQGLRLPRRADPDGRQVQRRGDEGRGAAPHQVRAALHARRDRPPRRRLLAYHRGHRITGQPSHARRRRQRPPVVHVEQRRGGRPAVPRAQGVAEPCGDGRSPRARTRTSTCT